MKYIFDSNLIIEHLNGAEQATAFILEHASSAYISAVTKIEVLGFAFPTKKAESAAEELIDAMEMIGLSNKIIEQTIRLRKIMRIKTPDAIIAATALQHQLVLVTRNTDDFKDVEGLTYINPFV